MGKIKIHELAKEIGMASKDVLEKAKSLGIDVASHLSNVTDEQATEIRNAYSKNNKNNVKKENKVENKKETKKETKKDNKKDTPVIIRREVILNHYLKYNSKRAIGFCTSRHHAEYMAKVFNENNIPSAAVYSGEKGEYSEERNIALSKLTSGEVKVIFSVYMFNEGLDVPAIDMVMFLRPTQSPTIFLQQLGING